MDGGGGRHGWDPATKLADQLQAFVALSMAHKALELRRKLFVLGMLVLVAAPELLQSCELGLADAVDSLGLPGFVDDSALSGGDLGGDVLWTHGLRVVVNEVELSKHLIASWHAGGRRA